MSSQVNFHGGKIYKKSQKTIFGGKEDIYHQHQVNVLRGGLQNNQNNHCITFSKVAVSGVTTSFTIEPTTYNTIRKGDSLLIVNKVNGASQEITASQSIDGTSTTLHIVSASLAPFETGSYIMWNNKKMNQRIAGGLLLDVEEISNLQYRALDTVPIPLITGSSNGYIFPVQVWIEVNDYNGTDEARRESLFLRYTSGTSVKYLALIRNFNYRVNSNSMWIFSLTGVGGNIQPSSIATETLFIESTGAFTNTDFTMKVFTQYQFIGH